MTLVGVGKTGYQVLSEILLHSPTERVSNAATVLLNRWVTRLPGYRVTRLPGYRVTGLPGYQVTRLPGDQVTTY